MTTRLKLTSGDFLNRRIASWHANYDCDNKELAFRERMGKVICIQLASASGKRDLRKAKPSATPTSCTSTRDDLKLSALIKYVLVEEGSELKQASLR